MIPLPRLALVGRPNVGKSTLFNRICGRRKAITDGRPGSTRDRNYAQVSWQGRAFEVVDTGGLLLGSADPLLGPASEQASRAIEEADVVLFVVDARAGLLPDDEAIARQLRRGGKRVFVVVNKAEAGDVGAVRLRAARVRRRVPDLGRARPGHRRPARRGARRAAAGGDGRRRPAADRARARGPAERRQVVAAQPAGRPRARRRLRDPGDDARHASTRSSSGAAGSTGWSTRPASARSAC